MSNRRKRKGLSKNQKPPIKVALARTALKTNGKGRNRTADTGGSLSRSFNANPLLYRLSYLSST